LGAGGVSLGQATISSGDKPVFVAIEPCRLVDTRPGGNNIGGRTAPLSANDTLTLQVTGSTGECSGIPAGATAAAMNVTAVQGSTRSFLTVYPADADLPLASNLNWNGGDPPTPNKVDVALSSAGAVKITNNAGTVHVAADLVGYYTDHHHDDRYYTKTQTDTRLAAKADAAGVYTRAEIDAGREVERTILASSASVLNGKPMWPISNCMTIGPVGGAPSGAEQGGTMVLPIDVPAGSTITAVSLRMLDGGAVADYSVAFQRLSPSISGLSSANLRSFAGLAAIGATNVDLTPVSDVVASPGDSFAIQLSLAVPTDSSERDALCSVTVAYTLP
jgi:hypothetical protein